MPIYKEPGSHHSYQTPILLTSDQRVAEYQGGFEHGVIATALWRDIQGQARRRVRAGFGHPCKGEAGVSLRTLKSLKGLRRPRIFCSADKEEHTHTRSSGER